MICIETKHIPPSVNAMFTNIPGRGRIKTARYREWASAAGWDFNGKGRISGPFIFRMVLSRENTRKGSDLDNRVKAPMDLLKTHGIIEDDSLCQSLTVSWGDCEGIYIEVEAYTGGAPA